MGRKKKHEDHVNHEAWAIPYGDLITLLLAFFVVMYSMSSVNEGKYRVLSDSLVAAFRGAPKSVEPIQLGKKQRGRGGDKDGPGLNPTQLMKLPDVLDDISVEEDGRPELVRAAGGKPDGQGYQFPGGPGDLDEVANAVEEAMQELAAEELVVVRRNKHWIEVEIRTDILFPSGSASIAQSAQQVLQRIAEIIKPFSNPIRVEGHTDNRPISTVQFPSNWELSAARAASVVHLFMKAGLEPSRMTVIGLGEYRPAADNVSAEGRNRNRRVVVVVLDQVPATPAADDDGRQLARGPAPGPVSLPRIPVPTPASTADPTPGGTP